MAVPKKKTSKTRTNRRYRTWVMKEQRRLSDALVLVPYGRGNELKPAHIYLDDGEDNRKRKNVKTAVSTEAKASKTTAKPSKKTESPKTAKKAKEESTDSEA